MPPKLRLDFNLERDRFRNIQEDFSSGIGHSESMSSIVVFAGAATMPKITP